MNPIIPTALIASVASCAPAQTLLTSLRTVSGTSQPTFVTHAPGDPAGRLFVVQRAGAIRIHQSGAFLPTPFIDLTGTVSLGNGEHGMFSMAFHPNYIANGYFYMMYTNGPTEDGVVARARRSTSNPNTADLSSLEVILRIPQTATRERGGWIGFGPDGFLYVASGIGGVSNTGQILSDLRGKLLRLDINGPDLQPGTPDDDAFPADPNKLYHIPASNPFANTPGTAPEIWASGLRNPWRCSFDRETGDFWIADVGASQREEINFEPAGFSGGRNYGWPCFEGTLCVGGAGCSCSNPAFTPPIAEYDHSVGFSISGGYVYRGCAIPDLRGTYFYADYLRAKVFSLRYDGATVTQAVERTTELTPPFPQVLNNISSFGEDSAGELYICDFGGEVFKILPRAGSTPPPAISVTLNPANATTCPNGNASFSVVVNTYAPATFQWRKDGLALLNGGNISGANTPTLTINPATLADLGAYSCTVSNACASATSGSATLLVCRGDYTCDGAVDGDDVIAFFFDWDQNLERADVNDSGAVDGDDVIAFFEAWDSGC